MMTATRATLSRCRPAGCRTASFLALGMFLAFAPASFAAAAPAETSGGKTNAPAAKVEIPKSVFIDDIQMGKDPFFPASNRREPEKPAEPSTPTTPNTAAPPVVAAPPDPAKHLSLQGLLGTKRLRLATIHSGKNSYTFAEGDRRKVETPDGNVGVRCIRITENSVVLEIEGQSEPRTLALPSGN